METEVSGTVIATMPFLLLLMVGGTNRFGARYKAKLEISGAALVFVIFKRNAVALTVLKRSIRLYPIVVWVSICIHFPPTLAAMENSFTRWPKGIYSCNNTLLISVGSVKSTVSDAFVTPSSVAQ